MANEKFITLDNLKTFKTNCDTAYSTNVILISQPSTATNGTIDTKYQEFIGEPNSIILFNNEYYTIEDKEHTSGFVTYSHVGYENNKHLLKTITITTSTRAWTLNTSEVGGGGAKIYKHTLELKELTIETGVLSTVILYSTESNSYANQSLRVTLKPTSLCYTIQIPNGSFVPLLVSYDQEKGETYLSFLEGKISRIYPQGLGVWGGTIFSDTIEEL